MGVHTPEFFWEKSYDRVVAAVKDLGIKYAVVQDNDSKIWNRFAIWAWPTTVLIDKKGIIRSQHMGSDDPFFKDQEKSIRAELEALLKEPAHAKKKAR